MIRTRRALQIALVGMVAPLLFTPTATAQDPGKDIAKDIGTMVRTMRSLRRDGEPREALRTMRAGAPEVRGNLRVVGQRVLAMLDLRKLADTRNYLASLQLPEGASVLQIDLAQLRIALEFEDPKGATKRIIQLSAQHAGNLDVTALHVRALLHREGGGEDFRAARRILEAMDDDSAVWMRHELEAELLAGRARSLMTDDSLLDDALPLLEQALDDAPHRGDIRALYADALVRWQRFDKAEEQLAIGLEEPGVDRDVLLMARGDLFRSTDRLEEAVASYEAVLESSPDDRRAKVGLARCRSRMGDKDAAVTLLEACLAQNPNELDALLVMAELREAQDRPADAEALLRRVLEVRPNHLKACWRLSRVLARQGRMEEVDELVERYESRRERIRERSKGG